MDKQLIKLNHAWFLSNLQRLLGPFGPTQANGNLHETGFVVGPVTACISDTSRNTKTDKKGKSHTYGLVTIEYIENVQHSQSGKGLATGVMKQIITVADKWSIDLQLRPMGVDGHDMTDAMLKAWYEKLGFTKVDGLYLVRRAKKR